MSESPPKQNLSHVKVRSCKNLENLFPWTLWILWNGKCKRNRKHRTYHKTVGGFAAVIWARSLWMLPDGLVGFPSSLLGTACIHMIVCSRCAERRAYGYIACSMSFFIYPKLNVYLYVARKGVAEWLERRTGNARVPSSNLTVGYMSNLGSNSGSANTVARWSLVLLDREELVCCTHMRSYGPQKYLSLHSCRWGLETEDIPASCKKSIKNAQRSMRGLYNMWL